MIYDMYSTIVQCTTTVCVGQVWSLYCTNVDSEHLGCHPPKNGQEEEQNSTSNKTCKLKMIHFMDKSAYV